MPDQQLPTGFVTAESAAAAWVARVLMLTLLIFLVVVGLIVGFIIAVPLIIIALLLYAYIRVRLYFKRARDPGGPLDGRHNVRVINRDE